MTLVRYESADHIATITMARSEKHNALNNALCTELREAWLRFRDSDDRVAVLASSEEKIGTTAGGVSSVLAREMAAKIVGNAPLVVRALVFPFVIPGRRVASSPESIAPQNMRPDGFRALASRAPE